MDLDIRCKNIIRAVMDGRQVDIPPWGKLAMSEDGLIGFVAEHNGEPIVLMGSVFGISLNEFLSAVAAISEENMGIITANNALQKIHVEKHTGR